MIPEGYNYVKHLDGHYNGWRTFRDRPVYPRQIHFYTPSGQDKACNFNCFYCCGSLMSKEQVSWEADGLQLIYNLSGAVPFHMYSGAYTEPTLNPRLAEFIKATKGTGACYGLKTNGSMLVRMEDEAGLMSTLINKSTSDEDFVSISLDAGFAPSHSKSKGIPEWIFDEIKYGMSELSRLRGDRSYPKLRISYLLNKYNDDPAEIKHAIDIAKKLRFDSIRFTQPHPVYGTPSDKAGKQWGKIQDGNKPYEKALEPYMSRWNTERPFAFFVHTNPCPEFSKCAYGYYQITLAPDGYVYRCTTAADKTFKELRLGKITSDLQVLDDMLYENQNPDFNPQICFNLGAYCCRAAVAVNSQAEGNNA